jgi:hypothetical protein|nr:hypothetical protein [Cytophagales bacterium]
MAVRYTKNHLEKIEGLFSETDYFLRYEKGNFKSGYCVLKNDKVVIVNKYFTLEGKINALLDILKELQLTPQSFKNKKTQEFFSELQQTELKL